LKEDNYYYDAMFDRCKKEASFFYAKMVCKKWDEAAKRCHMQWAHFLELQGPKQIGEGSEHFFTPNDKSCKISSSTGRCCVATHYKHLVPRYDSNGQALFKTTMRIFSKKYKLRVLADTKSLSKQIATAKRRVVKETARIEAMEKKRVAAEEQLEAQDRYTSVFKRKKANPNK